MTTVRTENINNNNYYSVIVNMDFGHAESEVY